MPLVPPAFPVNFRNWFPRISKKQIKDMFDAAGVPLGVPPDPPETGERRQFAMTYLGGIDWESIEETEKVLKAISIALAMDAIVPADRDELRKVCQDAGLRIEGNTVALPKKGGPGIKNLVFASKGYKPEIVLIDALTNEIQITKFADSCLVYDRPIGSDGFLWSELLAWWKETGRPDKNSTTPVGIELTKRLEEGNNEPEKFLMRRYSSTMKPKLGDKYPALIPQVYMHYDPYTQKERREPGPLKRQRMDFLLLLRGGHRIVLEVDGRQHYSKEENGKDIAKPALYAEMVAEDRRIKLRGYEVFRFGGYELMNEASAGPLLDEFFLKLFTNCGYTLK